MTFPFIWCKNVGRTFVRFLTRRVWRTDRQTDRRHYDHEDHACIQCSAVKILRPDCSVAAILTIADSGHPIVLRTKYILLQRNGGLRIGSETRPHRSPLEIILYSRSDDPHEHPIFGRKFVGVDATASIDIHGPWKQSWTYLSSTLQPGMQAMYRYNR